MKYALFLPFLFCMFKLEAQVSFDINTSILDKTGITSGVTLGICDMNNDGLDDIIRMDNTKILIIEYQNSDGSFSSFTRGTIPGLAWSMAIADVNEDGINDIIVGGLYDKLKLLKSTDQDYRYDLITMEDLIFLQGSNFVDINKDGHIDYFANSDDGISLAFANDGTGNFTKDTSLIYPQSTIPSDNSGNYSSIWTDFDNDGDIDVYISKCRLGIADPMDGRRVNLCFQNDGNNNFTEVAEEIGLRPLAQSWTSDFGDIDNDGDMDVVIANHGTASGIYINHQNTFTEISETAFDAAFKNNPIQILQIKFADFDNNGFLDIFACGQDGDPVILFNSGDLSFTTVTNPFQASSAFQSAAVGDLNEDGFLDILSSYTVSYNVPSSRPDDLFLNNGNQNQWISFNLKGTTSNINGIGARIELYGPWGIQVREVRSGEGYGVINTMNVNFGIANSAAVDSVLIKWPSSSVSKIINPSINQKHFIVEDFSCQTILEEKEITICEKDSILINGTYVNQEGIYIDSFVSVLGCDSLIMVDLNQIASYSNTFNVSLCDGASINIGGSQISTPGTYRDTVKSDQFCDSIFVYNVNMIPSYRDTIFKEICNGEVYLAQGQYQGSSGIYLDSFLTINGCDSVVITVLDVKHVHNNIFEQIEFCANEELLINGQFINSDTIVIDTLTNRFGCDSIITKELTSIHVHDNMTLEYEFCSNDQIEINGNFYNTDTLFQDSLINRFGCDSIITRQLTTKRAHQPNAQIFNFCSNEIQAVQGGFYNSDTIVMDTFTNRFGCDSIITSEIFITDLKSDSSHISLCEGESIIINGLEIRGSQNIIDTIATPNCDSLHYYIVTTFSLNYEIDNTSVGFEVTPSNLSYQWIDCQTNANILNAISSTFEPDQSGQYKVIITDENGCNYESSCLDFLISNIQEKKEADFVIRPNPVAQNESLYIDGITDNATVKILDTNAQLIFETAYLKEEIKLNKLRLIPGLYFIKIDTDKESVLKKMIVY